jgi:hypothetical protein
MTSPFSGRRWLRMIKNCGPTTELTSDSPAPLPLSSQEAPRRSYAAGAGVFGSLAAWTQRHGTPIIGDIGHACHPVDCLKLQGRSNVGRAPATTTLRDTREALLSEFQARTSAKEVALGSARLQ